MALREINTQAIAGDIREVFECQDIRKLTKRSYGFITLYMGFIAHYDLNGFCQRYEDLRFFARRLLTSEYSDDEQYNLDWADKKEKRVEPDSDHNKRIAETIRAIVAVVKTYRAQVEAVFERKECEADLRQAARLAGKYGYALVKKTEERR